MNQPTSYKNKYTYKLIYTTVPFINVDKLVYLVSYRTMLTYHILAHIECHAYLIIFTSELLN